MIEDCVRGEEVSSLNADFSMLLVVTVLSEYLIHKVRFSMFIIPIITWIVKKFCYSSYFMYGQYFFLINLSEFRKPLGRMHEIQYSENMINRRIIWKKKTNFEDTYLRQNRFKLLSYPEGVCMHSKIGQWATVV